MQISRKSLHIPLVEKMFQRLEGQREKGRNLQLTAQVKGEGSLVVDEIQEQLCQHLAPFHKPKSFENSPGDLGSSSLPTAGYKRAQTSVIEEEAVKEKKRKGNKQSKHGPGRPKGNKNQENVSHLSVSSASPTSSVASAAGSVTSSSLQKSPTLLRNGSLQSLSVGSSPVGSEISMQYRHDGACPTTTFSELLNAIHNG
ncbi:hypothetical protein U0070_020492, partial [Myodes glareolus]